MVSASVPIKRQDDSVAISNRTIARLAQPFEGGGGPTHSAIELIWTSADASPYLGEGNKLERVLGGLRALHDGRRAAPSQPELPADHDKLQSVASGLAMRLIATGLIDPETVEEALEGEQVPPMKASATTRRNEFDSPPAPQVVGSTAGGARAGGAPSVQAPRVADNPTAVMVVHGQDSDGARAMFDWLRAIGLRPREWNQLVDASGAATPFIGEVLEAAFQIAQAVVVLFTPDEQVRLRQDLAGGTAQWRLQARPNVLFEAGMAFATHPKRTVLAVLGHQEIPSDLAGRHYVHLGSVQALRDLAQRLERAGCPVDLTGNDWLDVSRFPDRSRIPAAPAP